jgi:hypothetical protein
MGYFSNGSQGCDYQHRYCENCVHDIKLSCPVWGLQLAYNGDAANNSEHFLDALIPRDKSGENTQCKMFVKKRGVK